MTFQEVYESKQDIPKELDLSCHGLNCNKCAIFIWPLCSPKRAAYCSDCLEEERRKLAIACGVADSK